MQVRRANAADAVFIKCNQSLKRNTALIAYEGDHIVGVLEYRIDNMEEASIIRFETWDSREITDILSGLVQEVTYWNPYLDRIKWIEESGVVSEIVLKNAGFDLGPMWFLNKNYRPQVFRIDINNITPEQLTVSEEKVRNVSSWITRPEDIVVSCVKIEDRIVCIDGYSRLIAGFQKGFNYVFAFFEEDICNLNFYKTCLDWCEAEGIRTISDLSTRIVTQEEHERLWVKRCKGHLQKRN